jgi:hypothetical protein
MIDINVTSRGYCESTKTTPMMYHITPLVCFCKTGKKGEQCSVQNRLSERQNATYFFTLAHKKANNSFIGTFKRGIIKSEDIGGDDDEHSARKHDYNTLRGAVGGIEIESQTLGRGRQPARRKEVVPPSET